MPDLRFVPYLRHLLLVIAATLTHSATRASDPALAFLDPPGAQRGTEIEVAFRGARLADAQEILFYEPGVEVKSLEAKPDHVQVKLAVSPECRLGRHAMRVRTATGISPLRTFFVGALPQVPEKEPNSLFDSPQPIELDTTVYGVVKTEDVDYFSITAKKGERISAEVEGLRLGRTFFDPHLAILNSQRFELAAADDSPLLHQDAHVSILAPEDGVYIIRIRESAYQGNDACAYRLHIGRFPRPTVALPAGGRPGETLDVQFLGDPLGPHTEKITLPAEPPRYFGLFRQDEFGVSPSPVAFRLNGLDNVMEAEPNNTPKEATSAHAPAALNGVIGADGDVDMFRFGAKKGERYDIRVRARGVRSPLDPVLNVIRVGAGGVGGNDDSGGPDAYLRFTAPEDGEYLVRVTDHLQTGGPDYVYRVEITPVVPGLSMVLPEWDRYVAVTAPVPRDNRMAFLVSAVRSEWGGDLNVSLEGLPPGVSLETVTMAGNQGLVPVLLTAAASSQNADAQNAGALVDVVGRPVDPNLKLTGHLSQRTWLVRGRNNRDVWNHYADRMAVAVTDPAPFKIAIVEPKVPLLQNGTMQLKIVATRKEGFKEPIAIRMLYNPPGVSSSGGVRIPGDKNEAEIPLTAAGNAQVRDWKIAVVGQANVGGALRVSTQLANLKIAPPILALEFPKVAVQQGDETDFVIKVTHNSPLPAVAKAELLGLPGGATTEPVEIKNETGELKFHIQTTDKARAGRHKSILCRTVVVDHEEPITHIVGAGELRIDEPLPPKKEEAKK